MPVVVWNRPITVLRAPFEKVPPEDRARRAVDAILAIPSGQPEYRVEGIEATVGPHSGAFLVVNQKPIFGLLKEDADTEHGGTFEQLLEQTKTNLETWLAAREQQLHWPLLLRGMALTVVSTIAFVVLLWGLLRCYGWWMARLEASAADPGRALVVGGVNLRPFLIVFVGGTLKLATWILGLGLAYLWLTFVLGQFPFTDPWSDQLVAYLLNLLGELVGGLVRSLPRLVMVVLIVLLARLVTRVATAFFDRVERGTLHVPWLHPETAKATRRVVVVLIWIFTLIVAYPFIPGSETDVFKGVSVFLGLMVSLGSANLISQVLGGLVVVYSRAFGTGDYVRVGEHEGTVREIGVLSTKLVTRHDEEVTIPNAVLVATTTVNYSSPSLETHAIVSTAVTIGYDAPWRQVHELLLRAASRTAGVLPQPTPRVLQHSLGDFYVEYRLLFHIQRPNERWAVLSELHAQIQDAFNESGVQIMSPHFVAQPDEQVVVPRELWHDSPPPPSADGAGR